MHFTYLIVLANAVLVAHTSFPAPAALESDCGRPASLVPLGTGCGATLGASLPVVGQRTAIQVRTELAHARGWLFFGPPGAPGRTIQGCEVFLQFGALASLATFTTDAGGAASVDVFVPASARLCGQQYVLQALIAPSSGSRGIGAVSNGLDLTLGGDPALRGERRPRQNIGTIRGSDRGSDARPPGERADPARKAPAHPDERP